jgi:hypothetical protein
MTSRAVTENWARATRLAELFPGLKKSHARSILAGNQKLANLLKERQIDMEAILAACNAHDAAMLRTRLTGRATMPAHPVVDVDVALLDKVTELIGSLQTQRAVTLIVQLRG